MRIDGAGTRTATAQLGVIDDSGLVGAIPSDGYGPDLFFSGPGQRRPSFCVVRDRTIVDDPRLPPPVGC